MQAIIISSEELRAALSEITREVTQSVVDQIRAENPPVRQVMTTAQLAEYLQVSNQSILNWTRRRTNDNPLPAHYAGADPRFFIEEVREWSHREAAIRLSRK